MKTDMLRLDPAIDAHCEHAIDVTRPRAKCEPIERVDRPASFVRGGRVQLQDVRRAMTVRPARVKNGDRAADERRWRPHPLTN